MHKMIGNLFSYLIHLGLCFQTGTVDMGGGENCYFFHLHKKELDIRHPIVKVIESDESQNILYN